jgi:zona occludens toxin (predicted ATPase)
MEQRNITLEKIYEMLKKIEIEIEIINNKLDWEKEFTEEENNGFSEGTRKAWEEIDEGKYTSYNSPEEFLATFK